MTTTPEIEAAPPASWQELERAVARILQECGYDVEVGRNVPLARGDVNVDVWADDGASPPNVLIVECKQWARPVTKNVVHAFRAVTRDSGANTGLLVSSAGFQDGAVQAAAYSNVRLLTWAQFQHLFAAWWFREHLCPVVAEETDALHEYAEPFTERIRRAAEALPGDRLARFRELRAQHAPLTHLNLVFHPALAAAGTGPLVDGPPALPLRRRLDGLLTEQALAVLPADVLDADALRPLLDALVDSSRAAAAQFDEVFGGRV